MGNRRSHSIGGLGGAGKLAIVVLTSGRLEVSRSHRILWLFEELGIPYELKTYKRTNEGLAPPELHKVYPLGKSPVVEVEVPGSDRPIVLAESAAIAEYFCDYYGSQFVPKRYREGKDGQIGGETESWLRYRMLMHYAEGSLMPLMLLSLIVKSKLSLMKRLSTCAYMEQEFEVRPCRSSLSPL